MVSESVVYGLVGAGGFGREVMPLIRQMLDQSDPSVHNQVVFVVENLPEETCVNGCRVISDHVFLDMPADRKYFNVAIADWQPRHRIVQRLLGHGLLPFSVQSDHAVVLDNNDIGEGSILCPFSSVTSNVRIGKYFHLNPHAAVAHDCVIGDYVTFAPGARCNGTIVIEDFAYVGSNVVIKQGSADRPMIIGEGAVIGMGAVVTRSVPPYTTVVGNPAAPLIRNR